MTRPFQPDTRHGPALCFGMAGFLVSETSMGDFGKTSLLVALVLAFVVCLLHEAKANVRPVKPQVHQDRPTMPLERDVGTVPCLRIPERPRVEWWMLVGPNGETLIIGAHEVRQRC